MLVAGEEQRFGVVGRFPGKREDKAASARSLSKRLNEPRDAIRTLGTSRRAFRSSGTRTASEKIPSETNCSAMPVVHRSALSPLTSAAVHLLPFHLPLISGLSPADARCGSISAVITANASISIGSIGKFNSNPFKISGFLVSGFQCLQVSRFSLPLRFSSSLEPSRFEN